MSLHARVARLEEEIKPTETCPRCSTSYIWGIPDDRLDDPTFKPICGVCGRGPRHGYYKLLQQSMLDELGFGP